MDAITEFRNQFSFLSNFHPSPIRVALSKPDEVPPFLIYPTAEHLYQALKTKDHFERKTIAEAETPGQAKKLGRKVTLIPHWEEVKDEAMLIVVRAKFTQNRELRKLLLLTGDRDLIEANSWGDTYWGVDQNLEGRNQLGKTLMQIREELRS